MHWIGRHILKRLAFADRLTYSELLPDGVEGNLFQYYARSLERENLIARGKDGYALTALGRRAVADMSATRLMRPRKQPQPMVAAFCRRGEELLIFKWQRHPYRGLTSLPMGRQLVGMSVIQAASDQLFWKAGLSGEGNYLGLVEIRQQAARQLESHVLINIVEFDDVRSVAVADGLTGSFEWAHQAELAADTFVPGYEEVINWCDNANRSSYLQIVIESDGPLAQTHKS